MVFLALDGNSPPAAILPLSVRPPVDSGVVFALSQIQMPLPPSGCAEHKSHYTSYYMSDLLS